MLTWRISLLPLHILVSHFLPFVQTSDADVLLEFKSATQIDPFGAFDNWVLDPSVNHPCKWYGIRCTAANRVTSLRLPQMGLSIAQMPNSLGILTDLVSLNLSTNNIAGVIPPGLGSCVKLALLDLSINLLSGNVPMEIGNLVQLNKLYLGYNQLTGTVEFFSNLRSLSEVSLQCNSFSGYPFSWMLNLNSITVLNLGFNNFSGVIDGRDLIHFVSIRALDITTNAFSGQIPGYLSNLTMLEYLDFGANQMQGSVPIEMRLCPNLRYVNMSYNRLDDEIPIPLGEFKSLQVFDMRDNLLTGHIYIGGTTMLDLRLGGNNVSGDLPLGFGDFTNLTFLDLSRNNITGPVPEDFTTLSELKVLNLSTNQMTGTVPLLSSSLVELDMSENLFEGPFPRVFASYPNLQTIKMGYNNLNGTIPSNLGSSNVLKVLNLSHNHMAGIVPNLSLALEELDLSHNNFQGDIPEEITDAVNLQTLLLPANNLSGTIPKSLGLFKSLKAVNLSRNNLAGGIPLALSMSNLSYFDVSDNKLSGEVPDTEVMRKFVPQGFVPGNDMLCGNPITNKCPQRVLPKWAEALMYLLFAIFGALICFFCLIFGRRKKGKDGSPDFSSSEILRMTNHFDTANLIAEGSLCTVYKGALPGGELVAVKKLRPEYYGDEKRFDEERQMLLNVKHPNIVRVVGSCSTGNLKALVSEYMPNGNLSMHLHNNFVESSSLTKWSSRMHIAAGVAQGLAYLHGEWQGENAMHCDIKGSSILLDENHNAKLNDVRLLKAMGDVNTGWSSGWSGYRPPEYSPAATPTVAGDVYSYGTLMLELITGRNPEFVGADENQGLHELVRSAYPNNLLTVVDRRLLNKDARLDKIVNCMNIGLQCTTEQAEGRPSMQDVIRMLET